MTFISSHLRGFRSKQIPLAFGTFNILNTEQHRKKSKKQMPDFFFTFIEVWLVYNIAFLSESHSVMSNSMIPWTIQSREFSRPEYWSR